MNLFKMVLLALCLSSIVGCAPAPTPSPSVAQDIKGKILEQPNESCIEGNCVDGKGVLRISGGKVYTGEFKGGEPHGHGTLTSSIDGSVYEGEYQYGVESGHGTLTFPDGSKYVGEFKHGRPNGYGTITLPGGQVYIGQVLGSPNGKGLLTYPDGQQYEGEWQNGLKHGYGEERYPNGDVKKGDWLYDKYIGESKTSNAASKKTEIAFIVPVSTFSATGKRLINLSLGQTRLMEAIKLLPADPDNPPERLPIENLGPEHVGKVREVLERAKLSYNPPFCHSILIFDNNLRLVIIQTNFLDESEGRKIYEKYKSELKLVYEPSNGTSFPLTRMQADIDKCVTLEVFLRKDGEVNGVGYIYTCSTE